MITLCYTIHGFLESMCYIPNSKGDLFGQAGKEGPRVFTELINNKSHISLTSSD